MSHESLHESLMQMAEEAGNVIRQEEPTKVCGGNAGSVFSQTVWALQLNILTALPSGSISSQPAWF